MPFTFRRRQFPIKLAYAMSINKSQGQTFKKIGLYLPEPCFTHGQLYVAFSLVSSLSNIKVKIFKTEKHGKIGNKGYLTKNVVFKELLKKA